MPQRDPQPVWIAMRPEEEELYSRIEAYISNFYQKYEKERKGLGFIMTVYRRRLTSSFYAVRLSLERRLAFLRGQVAPGTVAGADEDDLEQEDLFTDVSEVLDEETQRQHFRDEIDYYDMPWNPMRVEQRIGRIDRIGGHPVVQIRHYFYENTVEAKIYRALENRIGWFEAVVGELQPILARLGQAIQAVAMTPKAKQAQVLNQELGQIQAELTEQASEGLDLDHYLFAPEPAQTAAPAVTLADLNRP